MATNNPAGRLHALLTKARVPPRDNDNAKARDRWAEVLEVDAQDLPTLLARLSAVIALLSQVRAAIGSVPDIDQDRFLRYLPQIERAFSRLNLNNGWKSFASPIDKTAMYSLHLCDERLSALKPEISLPEDKLERLHQQVRDMFDDISANVSNPRLRSFLLEHLGAMDQALRKYRISGTPPLERAVEAAVGGYVIRSAQGDKGVTEASATKKLMVIIAVILVLNMGDQAVALMERIGGALPTGDAVPATSGADDAIDAEAIEGGGFPTSKPDLSP